MLIDRIQMNMVHDRLLLCVHAYDIRSGMKPSLVEEIFIVLKVLGGEGGGGRGGAAAGGLIVLGHPVYI
jgi:hypothetical protein